MTIGTPCKKCSAPSPSARLYFGVELCQLVNSIQDLYFIRSGKITHEDEDFGTQKYDMESDMRPISAILFCTIFDVLMTGLIKNIMLRKSIPQEIQDLLLKNYQFAMKKRDQLYPKLLKESFLESIKTIKVETTHDFEPHFDYADKLAKKRNKFVHKGVKWVFTEDELDNIPHELHPLFSGFVALHNYQNDKI
ncbi:MAG: hypothetical protein NW237_16430 [Cyanobacteriota bacterium]|nr:hypothetical protein [Cyanobacteriota bacterium]